MPPKKKIAKVEEAPAETKVEQVSKPAEIKEVKEVEAPVVAEKGKKGRPAAKAPAQNGDTVPNSKPAENKEEKSEPAPAVQEEKGKKGRKPAKAAAEEPVAKPEEKKEEKSEPAPAPVEEKGRKGRKPAAKSASEESVPKPEEKKEEKAESNAEEKGKKGRKPAKPVADQEEPPVKVSKPEEKEEKSEPAPVEEKGRKGRKPGKAAGGAGEPKSEEKKEAAPVEEKAKKGRKPGKAAAEAEPVSKPEEKMEVEPEEKPKNRKTPAKDAAEGEPPAKKSKIDKEEEKSKLRKEASLTKGMDFAHTCKTKDGREPNWKISSWNVNGLRAWMDKGGLSYLQDEKPDILCIQETKCAVADIPKDAKVDGYYSYWSSAEKAGYAGTCIYSKTEPIKVTYGLGIDKHDEEGRTITAEYDKFYLVNTYVPNSGRGLPRLPYRSKEWDVDFREYLNNLNKTKPVIMCGDLNVAHKEIDLANPKTNKKTAGFTVEERQGFTDLLGEGYIDSFRELYPEVVGAYSFWTYMGNARAKNVGWRLDYFVLSERLRDDLCDSLIRKDVMGSDHCPIVLFMAFK